MRSPRTVCVVSNQPPTYSETFIRAHLERLPARVCFAYGLPFPHTWDDGPLLSRRRVPRLTRRLAQFLLRFPPEQHTVRAFQHGLRGRGVDVVLAEYGFVGVAIAAACVEAKVPLVVHFHGCDAHQVPGILAVYGDRYPEMFASASAAIAVSRAMERQLVRLGCPPEKLHYSPYGVDSARFAAVEAGANPPLFVGVGRLVDKKAPYLTVLAFARVCDRVPEARLVLVGDGELLDACQWLARSLGIAERVEFAGRRPHEEVAARLGRARAFVQHSVTTSYGDCEGTPVAVLEASARALPVVATRHAGIRDAVVEGETGLLCDEGDIETMATHMVRLATDPELATQLGQAGRARVEQHYTMPHAIDRLWQVLSGACAG